MQQEIPNDKRIQLNIYVSIYDNRGSNGSFQMQKLILIDSNDAIKSIANVLSKLTSVIEAEEKR